MISFIKDRDQINLSYTTEYGDEEWVTKVLKEHEHVTIKKTFNFRASDLIPDDEREQDGDPFDQPAFTFHLATLEKEYFKIAPGIVTRQLSIFFHQEIDLDLSYFVADVNSSIFRLMEDLVQEDIYIGGDHPTAIPITAFEQLLAGFPTPYEKKLYAEARVSSILKDYLDSTKDSETRFQRYMNKKISRRGNDLKKLFKDNELEKYETILEKVEFMLNNEQDYSEKVWQNEILQIMQLLYPKYIAVLSNVPIKDVAISDRILDFLLVDSRGHIDIMEIKKPFNKSIITEGRYRNNYIPLRELSGTVMQLEKYIFFLNRWGTDGERYLSNKYKDELPDNLEIKITNPNGIIIMGRDDKLSEPQKLDFEVVKRKYNNVVDIITYDDLLHRLKATIEQIRKL